MNFVFISPNYPKPFWNWCRQLKNLGVNVLGIGDCPYDNLENNLKSSLTEYYKVGTLENYNDVYRAVAFFTFKYGRIDAIESNNEYWLEQDARLREDFNIKSGADLKATRRYKTKSAMKRYYKKAGVPTALYHMVKEKKDALKFIRQVGYPVIAKPDGGVGATHTYKIKSEAELDEFFVTKLDVPYIMEEFIDGDIFSYDAIINSKSEPLFESMTEWPPSILDIVNDAKELTYFIPPYVDEQLRAYGRATVKAFGVYSRFVHLEFFKLKTDSHLGKKGDFVALEANMRPFGGYTPDMCNYAHSVDVYKLWAEMMVYDRLVSSVSEEDYFCVYAGRRDIYSYEHTEAEVEDRFRGRIVTHERMPELMVPQLGNVNFTAKVKTRAEVDDFIRFTLTKAK